ncbi:MAG: efflux RND transporter periplasmic adaptor subunit [Acidobacteria bacterium]|nr:efflux RND transporter periplasmic adaptor subunit [Acidobacteriota bacterium]
MKKLSFAFLFLVVLAAGFAAGIWFVQRNRGGGQKEGRKVLYWVDPMHPAYRSDKPGIAPDCGMKLEPVYADSQPTAQASKKVLHYRDPAQPSYHSDKPGMNPETGNDLEPVYEGATESLPPGTIQVAVEKQQLIGVKFAVVEPASATETIRANGRVMQDETKITRVHPKIEGWIEKVHVSFSGQHVNAGDPLLTIYSPEMLATEQELLLALKARETMKAGPSQEALANSESLIHAARRRLELWDLSQAEIERVEQTGKAIRTVTLYSPASGYVMARNAFPSQKVMPETELYAIADLSRVWIMADIFETDSAKIRAGQPAVISQPFAAGVRFNARVSYIQPLMDAMTRTLKIRLEADNPGLRLKPEMYVDVEFQSGATGRMTVPSDAVINTGLRRTVFVDRGSGNLEPRAVEIGQRIGDRIEILRGLQTGERVVAAGAFLIDSEAQLKNAAPEHAHD